MDPPTEFVKIRVAIADDHAIVRDGLRRLLSIEADIDVVGEAADGRDLLDHMQEWMPDVILLDLRMPNTDGLAVLRTLGSEKNPAKVIIFTASADKNEFVQALRLGCAGIVLKQTAADLIVKSIRKVNAGENWIDVHIATAAIPQFARSVKVTDAPIKSRKGARLSIREREIVALIAQGCKNKQVAEKMFISEQTVKNHMRNIFYKLGVSDRLGLALYAIRERFHFPQAG